MQLPIEVMKLLQPGDILFVRGHNNLIDDLIRVGESIIDKVPYAQCYTHCAIYLDGNRILEAQEGRKSGFGRIGQYAGNYDIGHVNTDMMAKILALEYAEKQSGLKYDWLLILDFAFKALHLPYMPFREHRRRICSTYINDAYKLAGVNLTNKLNPTPEELAMSDLIDIEKGGSYIA